jgi:hypothetical protein
LGLSLIVKKDNKQILNTDTDPYEQELYKTLNYSNEQFDKHILFIASGALGISFAFIEKIVDLENASCKNLLINSWYLFAAVVFISLLSHFVSIMALRWNIRNYNKDKESWITTCWNLTVRSLNIIMMLGLLLGTILLIKFISVNI